MDSEDDILDIPDNKGIIEFSSFTQRVLASLIDVCVLFPFFLMNVFNILDFKNFSVWVILTLTTMAYKPWMEFRYGATLGKMRIKIKVISTDGMPLTIHQAITRYLPWIITNITGFYTTQDLFKHSDFDNVHDLDSYVALLQSMPKSDAASVAGWILIGSIMYILFNPKKQAGHDLIAQTYVVKNPVSR